MAATISAVLQRIKSDLQEFLPDAVVLDACRQVGHVWRRRQLDPVLTLQLFILQVLHFNTALSHLRHLSKVPMTAAGYCKARMRLPLAALQMLLRQSSAAMRRGGGGQSQASACRRSGRTFRSRIGGRFWDPAIVDRSGHRSAARNVPAARHRSPQRGPCDLHEQRFDHASGLFVFAYQTIRL